MCSVFSLPWVHFVSLWEFTLARQPFLFAFIPLLLKQERQVSFFIPIRHGELGCVDLIRDAIHPELHRAAGAAQFHFDKLVAGEVEINPVGIRGVALTG